MVAWVFAMQCAVAGEVEVRWGPTLRVRHDRIFSHVAFAGVSPVRLGLAADLGGATRHRVDVGVDLTSARAGPAYHADRTDGPDFWVGASSLARVDLKWTTTWTVAPPVRVGFVFDNRVDATSYDHGFSGVFGYMATFGLGPAAAATWDLSRRAHLDVGADVPLLAWVARSPYAMNDDPYIHAIASHRALPTLGGLLGHGRIHTVDKLQALTAAGALSVDLDPRWAVVTRLEVAVLRHAVPRPVVDLATVLEAGVAGRW